MSNSKETKPKEPTGMHSRYPKLMGVLLYAFTLFAAASAGYSPSYGEHSTTFKLGLFIVLSIIGILCGFGWVRNGIPQASGKQLLAGAGIGLAAFGSLALVSVAFLHVIGPWDGGWKYALVAVVIMLALLLVSIPVFKLAFYAVRKLDGRH